MKEIVEQGVTGFVVEAGDDQALAQVIIKLLEDENLRYVMGKSGLQRLQKLFTSERMAEQYEELLTI
jgi:glycosyltransferase involved in cell wall biosynthesis